MAFTPFPEDDAGQQCVTNLIDGKSILLPSSASFPITSAREGRIAHYGQTATDDIAKEAVDSAWSTFKIYRMTPVHERRRMLLRAAELFDERVEESKLRQMREMSCDASWASFTAMQVSTFCRECAAAVAGAVVGDIQPSYFGYTQLVFKEPIGPVLLIPPWNAAVVLSVRGIANALAAGCTVILKASELCPWTHQLVAQTFHDAGFPPGAINLVMADRSSAAHITEAIIAHPSIRKIEFIGSAAVGRQIGVLAARYLKPIFLELGDQSPAIVLDDADLKLAANMCAKALTMNHGQVCFSTERIIVQSSVRKEFSRLIATALKSTTPLGIAVSTAHAERAKATIDDAVSKGAKLLHGNSDIIGSASLAPSILTGVNREAKISNEEAFAPTAFIVVVETDSEAIEEANSRNGGLSAAVYTNNYERGLRMSRELEFGMININNMTLFAEPTGPAGGVKASGWGSNNGRYGIENFLYNKAVSLVPTGTKQGHLAT